MSSTIDDYRDDLARLLAAHRSDNEELADEAAEHLRNTRDELIDAGWSHDRATSVALERFGSADAFAEQFPTTWLPSRLDAAWLVATALCAIGGWGVLDALIHTLDAPRTTAGLWPLGGGVLGLALLEILVVWGRERDPRPGTVVARWGSIALVGGAVVCGGATLAHAPTAEWASGLRWLTLTACTLAALVAHRRRHRSG